MMFAPSNQMNIETYFQRQKRAHPEEEQTQPGTEVLARVPIETHVGGTHAGKLNSPTSVISYPINLFEIFPGFNQC